MHTSASLWTGKFNADVVFTRPCARERRKYLTGELLDYETGLCGAFPELPWVLDSTMDSNRLRDHDHFYAYLAAITFHLYANDPNLPI